jgi:hypothetical protein
VVDLSDDDDEGEVEGVTCFADSGLKRVIEALQTCPWNDFKGKFLRMPRLLSHCHKCHQT